MSTPSEPSRSSAPTAPAAYASAVARSACSRLRARRWIATKLSVSAVVGLMLWLSGCYVGHVATGQARLLWARRPIEVVVQDPKTPEDVREALEQVRAVRAYARQLGLSVDGRYRDYTPWPGDHVVTTVVAARPGSVQAAGFWFPIVGRVPYKGFFDASRADDEALRLRAKGLDVCQVPVRAYSTLGWFDDPITGPMLRQPEGSRVETIFHELVHATAFVPGQAAWNEGVASFVGEEARVRFFAETRGPEAAAAERAEVESQRRLRGALLGMRRQVSALYRSEPPGPERDARRAALEEAARAHVAALPLGERDAQTLAERLQLGDACLALTATYAGDTPCYASALEQLGGNLAAFVARLAPAAASKDPRGALLAPDACSPVPSIAFFEPFPPAVDAEPGGEPES
jgi:predicted aminopeptidase